MKIDYPKTFCGFRPDNYARVNDFITRSAQPAKENFIWLKNHGITDIYNFRTMYKSSIHFNEKDVVETLGMKYHNIPSITAKPSEKNVFEFLKSINEVKNSKGKAHIHCMAGADRTGMYAFIYKSLNNIDMISENIDEWIKLGHNRQLYPNLIDWAKNFVLRYAKK